MVWGVDNVGGEDGNARLCMSRDLFDNSFKYLRVSECKRSRNLRVDIYTRPYAMFIEHEKYCGKYVSSTRAALRCHPPILSEGGAVQAALRRKAEPHPA